jgi:hypothetical protein
MSYSYAIGFGKALSARVLISLQIHIAMAMRSIPSERFCHLQASATRRFCRTRQYFMRDALLP